MSANLPVCTTCNRQFSPDKGDIDNVDNNTGVCDTCDEVAKKVTIIVNDPVAAEAIHEKMASVGRQILCRKKAAYKNRRRDQPQRKLTPEEIKEAKRLAGTRRDRADYCTRFLLSGREARANGGTVPPWELAVTYIGSDYNTVFVDDNSKPTLGSAFTTFDPRFDYFLSSDGHEDEPTEEVERIEEIADIHPVLPKNPPDGFRIFYTY